MSDKDSLRNDLTAKEKDDDGEHKSYDENQKQQYSQKLLQNINRKNGTGSYTTLDATEVQPEHHLATVVQPEHHPATVVQPDHHPATVVQPDHHPATVVQPERRPATVVQPEQHPATVVQPEQHPATVVQPDHHPATVVQPEQHPATVVQPDHHPATVVQPEHQQSNIINNETLQETNKTDTRVERKPKPESIENASKQSTPLIIENENTGCKVTKSNKISPRRIMGTQAGEVEPCKDSDLNSPLPEYDEFEDMHEPKKSMTSSRRSTSTQTPRISLESLFADQPHLSLSHENLIDKLTSRETQTSNSSSSSALMPSTSKDSENEGDNGGIKDKRPSMYGTDHSILPKRYILLLMMFLGFAVVYSLRVNINVAIVAMVNNRTRITKEGKIVFHIAEFDWDSHTQALVIGSFYYGYWVLQVPGAWIALKMGATRIFGYGVLLASLMSLLTPVATRYHVYALAGVRMVQGLFLGVTYPCIIAIWAKWAPPLERSTMVTMAIAGSPVGNVIAIPLTGLLAKYGFDGGWPTVFYFFGFLGCMWYIIWECVIYDSPNIHPTITENEKTFITRTIAEKEFDPLTESLPWFAIFTSVPMWGIIFGHFGACWGYYTLFTQMPTYLRDVQHLDIKTMGLVAATPYLFKAFLGPLGGISADMLLRHEIMSIRGVRAFFYAVGCLLAGFFILMVGYYVHATEAIAFLILGVGFSGLNATGYSVNHLDIAPRYAGILMGISNSFATIPGFLSPYVTGHITKNKKASEWKIVFWITFIIYVVAVALYTIMCSGEKQWWAEGYPSKYTESSINEDNPEGDNKGNENNDNENTSRRSEQISSENDAVLRSKRSSRGSMDDQPIQEPMNSSTDTYFTAEKF